MSIIQLLENNLNNKTKIQKFSNMKLLKSNLRMSTRHQFCGFQDGAYRNKWGHFPYLFDFPLFVSYRGRKRENMV